MDGTLLGDDHRIAPGTLEAVKEAVNAGIRFMICTGRNFPGVMQELEGTDLVCDYIVGSGAATYKLFLSLNTQKLTVALR